jgi:hypothetical protein
VSSIVTLLRPDGSATDLYAAVLVLC